MINPVVASLKKSATLKITSLTKQLLREGKDVVNFAAGEPDFDTPSVAKKAAIKAIEEGFTKYTPSTGILELKEAIAEKLRKENKLDIDSKNIIVTPGAKYAIFSAVLAILNRGEEVIIPSPYWVSYPQIVKLAGGKINILRTTKDENFKIRLDVLERTITPKTKILILNYPNNPTGQTFSYGELKEIYEFIKEKNIFVLSDEIYEKVIYDGKEHISFASFPQADKFTLTVNGFSKAFAMTGWRIGYLVAKEEIIKEASKIIDHTTSCPASISQKAALAALNNKEWYKKVREELEERRNVLWKGLSDCKQIDIIKPEGTFYLFCDIRKTGLTSMEFCSHLLEKFLVSCIPADSFGAEGFVRMSFSTSRGQIEKGIERIKQFLKTLHSKS
jgi:aspartate aminotransferase